MEPTRLGDIRLIAKWSSRVGSGGERQQYSGLEWIWKPIWRKLYCLRDSKGRIIKEQNTLHWDHWKPLKEGIHVFFVTPLISTSALIKYNICILDNSTEIKHMLSWRKEGKFWMKKNVLKKTLKREKAMKNYHLCGKLVKEKHTPTIIKMNRMT